MYLLKIIRIPLFLFTLFFSESVASSIYDKGSNQYICMTEEEKEYVNTITKGASAERFFKDKYKSPCQYRYLYRYQYLYGEYHKHHHKKRKHRHSYKHR